MIQNFIKTAYRRLFQHKTTTLINILGLAVGLACAILIVLWVTDELSYDRFLDHHDHIYRVVEIQNNPGIGESHVGFTMGPLAAALTKDFPEVETTTRILRGGLRMVANGDRKFYENSHYYADSTFFQVFPLDFVQGDPLTALSKPKSIVITESIAQKYFGEQNPMHQFLRISMENDYEVTGVIRDVPTQFHLQFDFLISFVTIESQIPWLDNWGTNAFGTYALLRENGSPEVLEAKLPAFLANYRNDPDTRDSLQLYLQPLTAIHLNSNHIFYEHHTAEGNRIHVIVFATIALFVVLIAAINFMNLATAQSDHRAREVAMRKILGARRSFLIVQFLGETVLLVFIALMGALILVESSLPYFNELTSKQLSLSYFLQPWALLGMAGFVILLGLFSGAYPALFLSGYQPIRVIRQRFGTGRARSGFRQLLVVTQFTIAIVLIISTMVVFSQIQFSRQTSPGFNKEQVLTMRLHEQMPRESITALQNELHSLPYVKNCATAEGLPGTWTRQTSIEPIGSDGASQIMTNVMGVDFGFLENLEMEMALGRSFDPAFSTDSTAAFVVNEAVVRHMGWEHPLGQTLKIDAPVREGMVIGVVRDFHFRSFHYEIEPLVMYIDPAESFYLTVRLEPTDLPTAIAGIKRAWGTHFAEYPFEYRFLDERLNQLYEDEQRVGQLFFYFALLAIFISCLGLLGLTAYTVAQRTKEIGIRKVLGASIGGIVVLVSTDFLKLVILANIPAWPIAWYVMDRWLQQFAYRIDVHIWVFLTATMMALLVAILTVSFQATKAALTNPVKALAYE